MRLFLPTMGALAALQAFGVYAQEANECSKDINDCLAEAQADFAGYGCADSNDAACFCNGSLLDGVTTCATARCPTSSQEQISGLLSGVGGFCAAVQSATSAVATTSAEAATTSEVAPASTEAAEATSAPPTSAAVETSAAEETSSAVPEEEATTTVAVPLTTEATTEATTAPAVASDTAAQSSATESASATEESASGTSAASTEASATSSADAASESEDDEEKPASSGLSKSAQIGIGVGVTIAVLALLGIGLCFFLKNRRRQQGYQGHSQKSAVSQPLPGGGRGYDSRDSGSIREKNTYDLELMSNRYEDMLPRQQPRTMV